MLRLFASLALLALFQAASASVAPLPLKEFRRVVVADDALPVQLAAADELAAYAGRIAGTRLEVVTLGKLAADAPGLNFFVGDGPAERALGHPAKPWKMEEWLLHTVSGGLVLAGQDGEGDPWTLTTPAGSMLAVYTLLEDYLGVRWFWPGEFGEHVPAQPEAQVPVLNVHSQPGFEIRNVSLGIASIYHPKSTVKTERTKSYHTAAFIDAEHKWARRSRLGAVKSAGFSHSWGSVFELGKGKTYREHPEWFALLANGQRDKTHLCTTNPEVIDRMVDYVLKSKGDIVSISPSDGSGFCECERCRALDVPGVLAADGKHVQLSDRIFTYANEIARRVREKNPAKGCGIYAYSYYTRPPLKIEALEPNLYVSFVFQSAAQRDPENLREWRESVSGWKALGAKLVIREGWGNHYYHDLPFLHDRQIMTNLAEASQLGFTSVSGDGTKCFATMAPNFWAMTHLMWDPHRDTTHLMRDLYQAAYGPVAVEMEAYFEAYDHALDVNWSKRDRVVDTTGIAYANMLGSWGKLIPSSVVEEAEQHLKAAEAKAPAGEYADRLKLQRLGQDYTRVTLQLLAGYKRLAELGMPMEAFPSGQPGPEAAPEREALLKRAYDLGEQREQLLLAHRDWAGPDEGVYAFNTDGKIRQWHGAVKKALGIDKPSPLSKETLAGP